MTERPDVYETLDLALRIGEVLLTSGAGAADVTATMLAVTHACGVRHVTADVTFVDLTLRHQPSSDQPAALQMRRVIRRRVDYADLIAVDRTVNDLVAGDISRAEARDQVARIVSTGHTRYRWAVTVGWGLMGTGIALTLGGSLVVCLLAFAAACAIDGTQVLLPQHRIPAFYQQAAGGFVATVIAVAASATELEVNPSRVVTAGIVMLLAGVGIMGATQDALTGFPVTASARLIDALLNTAGIITGVGAGLTVGELLGVGLTSFKPGAAGLAEVGVTVLGAALAAAAFAFASYAPLRALLAVALVGALGQGVLLAVASSAAVGRTWGSALAAVTIGAVCYLVSGRFRVPPLVVVVPAIVPLLPGLDIYRGLALLAQGEDGVLQLASAFATALALAAGVILGQYLARPLKREAHRLEARLAGPHMVGPFRRRVSKQSDSVAGPTDDAGDDR
ncbi:MAG TPA: threonine/serine exporter family protein [Nocardioides sp.]|nr:threonine/serine exporter family protein [Nocardioides sp.]